MSNYIDDEEGTLDGSGKSRRFVSPYLYDELLEENQRKNRTKSQEKKAKKVNEKLKYGNKINDVFSSEELSTADQIRIAAGFQQAIVKITGYGKEPNKIMKHLAYISRNYDLPLEDHEQSLLHSQNNVRDLLSSWESIYFDNRKDSRHTAHMIFSVPPKTDRGVFKQLTREFLKEEFGGEHDYVFVQHDDTEHPHIHSVICLRSLNGKKLDPRKKYLSELRKNFAKKCREHGVMLDASRRFQRGLSGKSVKSELVHLRDKRNTTPRVDRILIERVKNEMSSTVPSANTGDLIRNERNKKLRDQFYTTAKSLYQNYLATPEEKRNEKELTASKLLLDYSKKLPKELTRADYLKELLGKETSKSHQQQSDFLGLRESLKKSHIDLKQTDMGLGDD